MALKTYQDRNPYLLCEDTFDTGPCGWTQLLDGVIGSGPIVLDSEIANNGSAYSLLLSTEDYSYSSDKSWGCSVAAKRLSRGPVVGKIYAEWWFAFGSLRAHVTADSPRTIDFGIDQAAPDATRRFFKFRWLNVDEANGNAIVSKFQVLNNGVFTDVPGAAIPLGVNENKRNLYHLEFQIDLDAGVYDGLRVNGLGFGALADTPDDETLRAFAPAPSTLTQFAAGLNAVMELTNRTNTNDTKCWANLAYFKAVHL